MAPFQPPAEPVKPSGGETYRGGNRPPAEPVRPSGGDTYRGGSKAPSHVPSPYEPVAPYQTYQSHPSDKPANLDPKDFMPVSLTSSNVMCCVLVSKHLCKI